MRLRYVVTRGGVAERFTKLGPQNELYTKRSDTLIGHQIFLLRNLQKHLVSGVDIVYFVYDRNFTLQAMNRS